ncbi:MAG: hypothetical protein JXQ96_06820 [Cyclobacteriaceae bacterium]
MKKTLLLSIFAMLIVASGSFAQTTPKKEFTVSMSEKAIDLIPGETQTIDVTINRSKAYRKAKIDLSVGSILPEGITIEFIDGDNPLTERKMIVNADNSVANVSKTLILKAKSSRVTKGVMFKLNTSAKVISAN